MGSFYDPVETKVLTEAIVTGSREDEGWRPLFAGRIKEDLSPLTQERMHKMARYLYFTNPLAHAIIELKVAFIVGGGMKFEATDPRVNDVLRKFWTDPASAWDIKLPVRVRDLCLDGELYLPVFVHKVTGFTRVGFINPLDVAKITVDENNVELLKTVELKSDLSREPGQPVELKVVNYNDKKGRLEGQIFVFGVNRSADSPRGLSDLLPLIDWLGLYDQLLFNALERTSHMNAWYWDVLLEDFTEDQIAAWLNSQQGKILKPGSVRAHNQKVKWSAIAPELGSSDLRDAARVFKLQIICGAGMPESFFGESSEARASLVEAQESSFRLLQERQDYVKYMIKLIFNFVIDRAIEKKVLPDNVDRTFRISLPQISIRDLQRGGGAMFRFSQALDLGVRQGWISPEQARQIFVDLLSVLGFEAESWPTVKST